MRKLWMITGSCLAGAFLAIVIVYGWSSGKTGEWWAAWGQWVGGIGSIAAAVAALWIAWQGWKRADGERRDTEAAQARLVTAEWRTGTIDDGIQNSNATGVFVINHSERPIHHVSVDKIQTPPSWGPGEWSMPTLAVRRLLGPQGTYFLAPRFRRADGTAAHGPEEEVTVTVAFMDADGRRWTRTGGEQPQRPKDPT